MDALFALPPLVPHSPSQPRNAPAGLGVGRGTKGRGHSEDVGKPESERRRLGSRPAHGFPNVFSRTDLSVCLSVGFSSTSRACLARVYQVPLCRPRHSRVHSVLMTRHFFTGADVGRARDDCSSAGGPGKLQSADSPGKPGSRKERVRLCRRPSAYTWVTRSSAGSVSVRSCASHVKPRCSFEAGGTRPQLSRHTVSPRCRRMRDFLGCLRVARRKSTRGGQRR